jgi:DNA mismatch endonuclease (patch repair protein)
MSAIRGKDTKPEMIVRRAIHAAGFRYRLHRRDLPGTPDLVFPRLKAVIFVHGCFWHHHGCSNSSLPKVRAQFWKDKLLRNRCRDAVNQSKLILEGWQVRVLWECELSLSKLDATRRWLRRIEGAASGRSE